MESSVEAAKAFFDEFVEAFASFDGAVIAQRYQAPYLARHADGTTDVFDFIDDIAGYFQRIVDGYRERGCSSCRYRAIEVEAIGTDTILGTVTWELLRGDGSVLATWREAYALSLAENRLKAFASIDHAS